MKETHGDLISLAKEGAFDVLAHGCNCMCTMGAGIAKGIRSAFPEAYDADRKTEKGSREKLGTCSFAEVSVGVNTLAVVNAYTQFDWRGSGTKVDYDAVRNCMAWIRQTFSGSRIGLPLIGAGLAGGDWQEIKRIISEELADEDVTIVHFQA
jgi:O-acetyl-ADP-ribose deacetylase (regulator of RNase III)